MRITDLRSIRAGKYLFLQIETDDGITGTGEAGAWSYLDATMSTLEKYKKQLIGKNPFDIEHHWQTFYRSTYFRGSVIMSAISAIDIALWDIKGKALGVPIYELLGGKCRDRVRSYAPVFEFTADEMAKGCKRLQQKGFTAARLMLTDVLSDCKVQMRDSIYTNRVRDSVEKVAVCREAVGNNFDLCLELHRSFNPAEAISFIQEVAPYHPMFVEDPIPPDNYDVFARVAQTATVPLATGERFINIQEFELLLSKQAARYVRPDLCALGGISSAKKVASIAEAHYVGIVPHNPLGPVSTAACLQLDACIPNFSIQEFPSFYESGNDNGMMVSPFKIEDGCILLPDAPGLGIELVPDIEKEFPPTQGRMEMHTQIAFDGSVRDY